MPQSCPVELIRISDDCNGSLDALEGLSRRDDELVLDLTSYRRFIEEMTGEDITGGLTGHDAYRIRNRLEGFIEEQRESSEWSDELVADCPNISSLDEVVALARIFRHREIHRAQ